MKIRMIFLTLLILIGTTGRGSAKTPVDLCLNGDRMRLEEQPILQDGTVYVPIRSVAESLSFEVVWNARERVVSLRREEKEAYLGIGAEEISVGAEMLQTKPAWIFEGRAYCPVRSLAAVADLSVEWNQKTKSVLLTNPKYRLAEEDIDRTYSDSDLFWLAKIVHAEAQGEEEMGKIAVANVVLNRVQSDDFPNDIYGVIFDRKYGVQFTPTANGAIDNDPHEACYAAAKKALYGARPVGDCLYFLNEKLAVSTWITENRSYHATVGNHKFYL